MKTFLPTEIKTSDDANFFLEQLWKNGESFHPEDNVYDICWNGCEKPSQEELEKLKKLQDDMYSIDGYDPCEILVQLDGGYAE